MNDQPVRQDGDAFLPPYSGPITIDAALLHALWCYGNLRPVTGVVYSYGTHQKALDDADKLIYDRANTRSTPTGGVTPAPDAMRVTLEHAEARFLCLADHFKETGEEALLAMSNVDAELMREGLNALSAPVPSGDGVRWRHKARGTTYTEIGRGRFQGTVAGMDCGDYESVVLYRSDTNGALWVRTVEEFDDGRFERLSPSDAGAAEPYNWKTIVDAIKHRLRVSSDNDYRNWREIERVVRTTIAAALELRARSAAPPVGGDRETLIRTALKAHGYSDYQIDNGFPAESFRKNIEMTIDAILSLQSSPGDPLSTATRALTDLSRSTDDKLAYAGTHALAALRGCIGDAGDGVGDKRHPGGALASTESKSP